jgi:hypothetical protein
MDEWPWCSQAQGKEGLKIKYLSETNWLVNGQAGGAG